jgi:cyclase
VVPVLLVDNGSLVKTVRFKKPTYVGDPVNNVRLFSEQGADELIVLDIAAGPAGRPPDRQTVRALAGEAFMPVAYGGGVRTLADAQGIFELGIEKVVLGAAAVDNPGVIDQIARRFGAQSVVVCIDVARRRLGPPRVVTSRGTRRAPLAPDELARQVVDRGAGEVLVQSVDRDGTMSGYDLETISAVAGSVSVPVIACGGAGSLADLKAAVTSGGASAVAAGSLFTFHGRHRAVLINYPGEDTLEELLP